MAKAPDVHPSPKQERFCREYMVDFNGTQAAIRAGYSPATATVQASNLLAKPHIQTFVKSLTAKINENLRITPERVAEEWRRMAFYDIADYYEPNKKGKMVLKALRDLTPEQRSAIHEIDYDTQKIKLYNRDPALDKLAKHLKMYTDLDENQLIFTVMPELKLGGKTIIFNVGAPKPKKS